MFKRKTSCAVSKTFKPIPAPLKTELLFAVVYLIIAAVSRNVRRGPTRNRCIEAIRYIDFNTGDIVFWFPDLKSNLVSRVVEVFRKAGLIVLVKPFSFRKLKAEYRIVSRYIFHTEVSSLSIPCVLNPLRIENSTIAVKSDRDVTEVKSAKICGVDCREDCFDCMDLGNDLAIAKAELDLEGRACFAFSEAIAGLSRKRADARTVEKIVDLLARGSVTLKQLRKFAPSPRTLERALSLIDRAGHLMVTGLGRSIRMYSLIAA